MLDNTLRIFTRERSKATIFTKYKDTLDYLAEQIPQHRNFRGIKVVTLFGELNETQRKERFKEFEQAKHAVMIATDGISEGLNLQYIASRIIHYELPWNIINLVSFKFNALRIWEYGVKASS
jgi:superfamily II DNA/RNA helicase